MQAGSAVGDGAGIAALGIIFYLIMDIAIHWGIFRHLRHQVKANAGILLTAIALDLIVLVAFCFRKLQTDPGVIGVAAGSMVLILLMETLFIGYQYRSGSLAK